MIAPGGQVSAHDSAAAHAPRRVTIDSFDALLCGLRHVDPAVRHAVLRAVSSAPVAALAYRSSNGRDVVDELLALVDETSGAVEHPLVLSTLLRFDDARVIPTALAVFETGRDERLALIAAARLARLDPVERRASLTPIVMQEARPNRARAAANLLADLVPDQHEDEDDALPLDVALRITLLSDHDLPVPPLTNATRWAWQRELVGPRQRSARAVLERADDVDHEPLWCAWDTLEPTIRSWLLERAIAAPTAAGLSRTRALIDAARLDDRDDAHEVRLSLRALMAAAESVEEVCGKADEGRLALLIAHPDASVRAAAIAAGAPLGDTRDLLRRDHALPVRLAVAARLYARGDDDAVDQLLQMLDDEPWQVRSRAASALGHLGARARPGLERVFLTGSERARVAAAQGRHTDQTANA